MKIETPRLLIREVLDEDVDDLFEMDSDPEVSRYVSNDPVTSKEQIKKVIQILQQQYLKNGIARWAVTDKHTGECLGWAGLKYHTELLNGHTNIYELGYRFKQKHWGKGLATESSQAILDYTFREIGMDTIFAIADAENNKSIHVLEKLNFKYIETFDYDGMRSHWYALKKPE